MGQNGYRSGVCIRLEWLTFVINCAPLVVAVEKALQKGIIELSGKINPTVRPVRWCVV